MARTANALRMVLARHPDETIVLVGHDSVNRALLLELLDLPLSRLLARGAGALLPQRDRRHRRQSLRPAHQ